MGRQLFSCMGPVCQIIGALCVVSLLWGCGAQETTITALPDTTPVTVAVVQPVITDEALIVSGALEAHKTAPLNFLVPGKVDCVYVDEGDRVTEGQILAVVESHDYVSRLEIAEAGLLRAQDAFDRFEPLVKEGAFAESNFIELKSGLAQSVAARDIAKKRLKDTELRTPIPGIVGLKSVEVGQMVSPEVPVFTVVKTDVIFARVTVPESEVGKVEIGQSAEVTISALRDLQTGGTVSLVGAVADPQTRSYTVKVRLDNPGFRLRPGMIVQARIQTGVEINSLTVPVQAIVRDADNLSYVFTVNPNQGRAERRRVSPGAFLQNAIEIISGLEPGDMVIVGGHHKLSDGALVSIDGL